MSLRYCLPEVKKRGYGLGNEFIPWARAHIAARVLDATLLPPAFGLNRRRYWRHFDTPLDDWLYNRALVRLLPCIEFTEQDYLEHGGDDLEAAIRGFAQANGLFERRSFVLKTSGLWGGLGPLLPARDFIRATLYGSRFAARNLARLGARLERDKLLVGMHVRLGDFQPARADIDYSRAANQSLPIDWFCAIARSLLAALPGRVQFLVVSDGPPSQLLPLTSAFPCVTTADLAGSDCSDLLALAGSDLIACSASTFSSLAALLSESPYLWFAGNLHRHEAGCYSFGNLESASRSALHAIDGAVRGFEAEGGQWPARGFAVDGGGEVPAAALALALARRARRLGRYDLVTNGVIPAPAAPAGR